jgi:hypothetical protein
MTAIIAPWTSADRGASSDEPSTRMSLGILVLEYKNRVADRRERLLASELLDELDLRAPSDDEWAV